MNREFVLIPHGNQLKIIRELQSKICLTYKILPVFPLFVRFQNDFEEKFESIKNCVLEKIIFSENEINLFAKIELKNQQTDELKILDGKIKIGLWQKSNIDIHEENISIPFPVFKLCEVEFTESESRTEWKIFSEKWIKA